MRVEKRYMVLRSEDRKELQSQVDIMALNGWVPQGGVTVVPHPFTAFRFTFYQAMWLPEGN